MREADSPIFQQTRQWLEQPGNVFHLIIDELHLYRGTSGTEVAYLLRLLLRRLGLTPTDPRLRILASSASLDPRNADSLTFLSDFFGCEWEPEQIIPGSEELIPEPIDIEIFYRDEHLVVVNKPPGLVMYPAAGHRSGTLMNALLYNVGRLAEVGGPLRPGVVHRLDKDTSGLIVVALSDKAYYGLVSQFKERTIKRLYYALVFGELKEDEGVIERPIGRSETHRKKMSTRTRRGRYAKTFWRVIQRLKGATLVEARLATGRTHQIRVHFASIGHPVLGDNIYGRKRFLEINNQRIKLPRQMLHAVTLGFVHPIKGEWLEFKTELPEDMKKIVKILL